MQKKLLLINCHFAKGTSLGMCNSFKASLKIIQMVYPMTKERTTLNRFLRP